jgi:hypothetical protein
MARKTKTEGSTEEKIQVSPAKAKGEGAVKDAAPEGATAPVLKAPAVKRGKLRAKNKSRLPRKEKKAQKKLAATGAK